MTAGNNTIHLRYQRDSTIVGDTRHSADSICARNRGRLKHAPVSSTRIRMPGVSLKLDR